jgi:decaprenyl-phosphate phosphoribosyltransferase
MNYLALLELLRPKQISKQVVVFLPIIAIGSSINLSKFLSSLTAVCSFALASGFVYVVNDLSDLLGDQNDPTKAKRPYASGRVTSLQMYVSGIIFFLGSIIIAFVIGTNFLGLITIILFYCLINLFYSVFHLKDYKIIGLVIVGLGFPLRFIFGSLALGLPLSPWGFVLLFQLAVFMLAGKRYQTNKRKKFLKKEQNSIVELDFWLLSLVSLGALFSSSYVGFTMSQENQVLWGFESLLISTIPLGLGILRYLEIVTHPDMYKSSDATESIRKDKLIILLAIIFSGILAHGRFING